jgi:hypothetical protein
MPCSRAMLRTRVDGSHPPTSTHVVQRDPAHCTIRSPSAANASHGCLSLSHATAKPLHGCSTVNRAMEALEQQRPLDSKYRALAGN